MLPDKGIQLRAIRGQVIDSNTGEGFLRFYILVAFWLTLAAVLIKSVFLCMDHPRVRKPVNVGEDALSVISGIAFMVWQVWLLWGN